MEAYHKLEDRLKVAERLAEGIRCYLRSEIWHCDIEALMAEWDGMK